MATETNFRIGCLPMLFIIFLILKLTSVITWSWWWVCSPLIAMVGLWLFWFVFILGICGAILGIIKYSNKYGL
jgi:hypothetical protein